MRVLALLLVLPLVYAGGARAQTDPDPLDIPPIGDYLDAPVYYDLYLDRYASAADLPTLRKGMVRVQHYAPMDVREFAWGRASFTDYTWWMQMQEMRFILPLIASTRKEDNALAADWLTRWFAAHLGEGRETHAWGESMTWGYRAMVFVYYLRTEQRRTHPDADVVGMLQGSILEHQQKLAGGFHDANSNHGFIDALGLYETTRVYDDEKARSTACERLRALADKSVSAQGFHREHAAAYHFVVLRWLDEMAQYLESGRGPAPGTARLLRGHVHRMQAASYYLQDHRARIPQIGDSDSLAVDYYGRQYRAGRAPAGAAFAFDTDAGYAVHRGTGRDRRYVVFRVPADRIEMSAHTHSDGLAVLYAVDGETLLGDGGRYWYKRDARRDYFTSGLAHNTVLQSLASADPQMSRAPRRVEWPRVAVSGDTTCFSAAVTYPSFRVRRTVEIPQRGALTVRDTVRAGSGRGVLDGRRRGASQPAAVLPVSATLLWNVGHSVTTVTPRRDGDDGVWSWRLRTRRGHTFDLVVRVAPSDSGSVARARLARGENAPMLGWYSPRFGVYRASPVIVLDLDGAAVVETRVDEVHRRGRGR